MITNESDNRGSACNAVVIPRLLLDDLVGFAIELRGEWNWKKDEPRNRNQSDYNTLCALIEQAVRYRESERQLICDECGAIYPDDAESDVESCESCGRFKQRMDWANVVAG